jgi:O-antigen/teichoic acid export membrane protein
MSSELLGHVDNQKRDTPRSPNRIVNFIRGKHQHARNLFAQVFCRFVTLGLFAISLPFFVARQGAAPYGVLALLLSIYSLLILLDLGVSYSVGLRIGRSLARNNGRESVIFARAIPLAAVLGAGVFIMLFLVAGPLSFLLYGSEQYAAAVRIFGGTVGIYLITSTPAAVVQIYHRVDWFNYSKLIMDVAKAAALVLGGMSAHPIQTAMWVLLCGAASKCAVDFLLANRLLGHRARLTARVRRSDVYANIGLGIPMSVAGIVSIALTSGDRILVSRLYGAQALAHYSLAVDICSKAYFLVWAVTGTLYPLVIRHAASGRDVSPYRRAGLVAVAAVGILVYLPIGLLAYPAINWWLGPEMARGASFVTSVWALVAVIYLMTSVLQYQLQAKGRPNPLLGVNLVGVVVLLVGAWAVPRKYGILGIAILMGVIYSIQFAVLWMLDNGTVKMPSRMKVS